MLTFMGSSQSPELRPRGRAAGGAEATMTTPSTSAPFAASPQSARSDEHGDDDGDDRLNAFSMRHAPTASTTTAAAAAPAATTYIIDGDGESWNTQSIRRATLVHDGVCAMRVRDARAKERRIDARVRVMVGAGSGDGGGEGKDVDGDGANNSVASRTLRVHVSCDDDPFFYHAMEVREEDYARLRSEQRLVVDFDAFPRALVGLLRACDGAGGNKDVYCMLESTEASSSSVLSIVETNAFNQFTHVALKFKPASDRAAKRILAGLLLDAKERERELQRFETLYRESQDALEISRSKSLEVQMKYAEASARGKREILDELEHARERFEQEKRELRARVDEALAQRSELEREKFAAQNKVSELGTKLGLIEGELTITKRELQRTREDNAALDAEVHERDKAHSSRALRVEWLEKQLGDKEEVIALLKSRLDATEEHKVALAASWEQARRSAAKAEERLAASAVEINKGNAIIEQLQNDLRTTKSKTKIQAAVIRRQENLLEERQTSMSEYAGDRAERSMETADLLDQVKTLKTREADLSAKIAESQALLTSNQQVIQWLNQQLTEASLNRAPAAAPSRVATRQPSTPPVAGRPSTSATANDANQPLLIEFSPLQ
jgi:spindle assembly abnormal protein 6